MQQSTKQTSKGRGKEIERERETTNQAQTKSRRRRARRSRAKRQMEQIDKASCGNWDGAKDDGNGGWQGAALIEPAPGEGNNKMQPEASNVSSKKKIGWKEAKTSSEQIAQAKLSPQPASPPIAEPFIQFITIYHYFVLPPPPLLPFFTLCACDIWDAASWAVQVGLSCNTVLHSALYKLTRNDLSPGRLAALSC